MNILFALLGLVVSMFIIAGLRTATRISGRPALPWAIAGLVFFALAAAQAFRLSLASAH